MAPPTDAVVAGSKAFALALFAPLMERTGSRPRIAPEPHQALAMCTASTAVLIVEYGPQWLPILQQLHRQASGLRVIAALPKGQEAAALQLAPLGADAVPWDGQPGPVLVAVERLVAGGSAPSPARPAAAPPPRVATTPPLGSPAQPAPPRLATTPPLGSPSQPAPPRLATTPPAGAPMQPAPPRLATTPPAGSPAQPAPPRLATTPPAGSPTQPAPPRLATTPPVGSPAQSRPPAAPQPGPAAPVARPASAATGMDDLFSGLDAHAEHAAKETIAVSGAPSLSGTAPPPYLASPAPEQAQVPGSDWPVGVPDEDEAEAALVLALRGKLQPDAPLAGVAAETLAALSELERRVLSGEGTPFEARPIYRAAVMRLRMAAALGSAPQPPALVDQGAVQALLADLDALLAEINPLAAAAPPDLQPSVESIRNGLVRVAVDFSEAAHRLGTTEPVLGEAQVRPALRAAAQAARVISVNRGVDDERTESRRRRGVIILFVAVVLGAAGVHGYRYLQKERAIAALPSMPGSPEGMVLLPSRPGAPKTLMPVRGAPDRLQVEKFKAQQLMLGNQVTEQTGGVLTIKPLPPPPTGGGQTQ